MWHTRPRAARSGRGARALAQTGWSGHNRTRSRPSAGDRVVVLMQVVVVSGLAGAGKSTAARALEDLGYFVVDNLPAALMGTLVTLAESSGGGVSRVALVVDAREGRFLEPFPETFRKIRGDAADVTLLFLEAKDEVLQRRFSETRRRHPLAPAGGTVADGIATERSVLEPIRELADDVIDSSNYNVHELKKLIMDRYGRTTAQAMTVTLLSFGFKYGLPQELDLCVDVRFLPNPFHVPDLRPLSGLDSAVASYVFSTDQARQFVDRYESLLAFLLPAYAQEGKRYLTVGVGCTGGQHRSVAIVQELQRRLALQGHVAKVRHRDVEPHRGVEAGHG